MWTVVAYEQRDVADAKAFRGRILRVHSARDFCYGLLFTEALMINVVVLVADGKSMNTPFLHRKMLE